MGAFVRDTTHWLRKFSPQEWIRAALAEVRQAERAYKQRNAGGGLLGCRRAAGMALNAVLLVEPHAKWGRTYVDHLLALRDDASAPIAVQTASRLLLETQPPGPNIIFLRSKEQDERVLEAARDVVAHAYAVVARHEAATAN